MPPRLSKFRTTAVSQDLGASDAKAAGDETARRGSYGEINEEEKLRRKRVQVHSLREVSSSIDGAYSSPDVEFILEVKRSNAKVNAGQRALLSKYVTASSS